MRAITIEQSRTTTRDHLRPSGGLPYEHRHQCAKYEASVAYYHLTAFDRGGNTVLEYDVVGGSGPDWPEKCRQTGNTPGYAWTLQLHSDGGQSEYDDGFSESLNFSVAE